MFGTSSCNLKLSFKYFLTSVDDFSRVTWFYLMKEHFELFSIFYDFVLRYKHSFSDYQDSSNGQMVKEYFSDFFFLMILCIPMVLFINHLVFTTRQNGVVEKKNKHALVLLFQMNFP